MAVDVFPRPSYDPTTATSAEQDGRAIAPTDESASLTAIELRATLYDLNLRTQTNGDRALILAIAARYWDDILKLCRYVGTPTHLTIADVDLEATLSDLKLKTQKDGIRRVTFLVPSRCRPQILALCGQVGAGVEVAIRFDQLPLFGRDAPSDDEDDAAHAAAERAPGPVRRRRGARRASDD